MERKGHHHTARHRPADEGGPEIESIPLYGTTWYTGGPGYWLRRVGVSLAMLSLVSLCAGMAGGVVVAIIWGSASRSPDLGPGLTALGIATVVTIVGFVWMWRWTPDARESEKEARQADVFVVAYQGLGWVVLILFVVAAVAGGVVRRSISAALVLLIGLAFFGLATFLLGPMLALFVKSITEEPQTVRLAREELDTGYLEPGHDSPGSIRPT